MSYSYLEGLNISWAFKDDGLDLSRRYMMLDLAALVKDPANDERLTRGQIILTLTFASPEDREELSKLFFHLWKIMPTLEMPCNLYCKYDKFYRAWGIAYERKRVTSTVEQLPNFRSDEPAYALRGCE